jgi:tRNA pseudouridine55 synthase
MNITMPPTALIYKNLGETPLEALERFRSEQIIKSADNFALKKSDQDLANLWQTVPMTYAGRLDPVAEGELLILIGDECRNKDKYLGLDKEYEVKILFGVTTDTHDILGVVDDVVKLVKVKPSLTPQINFSKYVGKFLQPYPAYSSKTVNGKQLHELARTDQLPDEMPEKEVEIYSISESEEVIPSRTKFTAQELQTRIFNTVDLVKGDFRQNEIKAKWQELLQGSNQLFDVVTLRVKCSSGTYMRSLAHKIGQDSGFGAIALSIVRTRIFL